MVSFVFPGSRFRPKLLPIIGLAIILLAVGTAASGLNQSFRPYTTLISEATSSGRSVQLAGYLGSTGAYDAEGRFTFLLQDDTGALVLVVSPEPKPANFEHAVHIVAIGRYDTAQQAFLADELLVKCPSKYQEMQDSSASGK